MPEATAAARDDEAFVTSLCTASEPELRPAPVRVRVPLVQTEEAVSAARVPKPVRVRPAKFQTLNGIEVASDVEAARTTLFVLAFTVEAMPAVCELVFAFTTAAIEEEALLIFALTADVIPEVWVFVFELI